jgi:phosphohistidine phosphatase
VIANKDNRCRIQRSAPMKLYLMQHGEARPEQEDPARPLTERGRAEVERVARAAARLDLGIAAVAHSGKLRARQTAETVASLLEPSPELVEVSGLGPNTDPHIAAEVLTAVSRPHLLVGHLPHLSRLASLLILDNPDAAVVAFRMAGLVCLSRGEEGWRLAWALVPELVSGQW